MKLIIDVGNTRITFALFEEGKIVRQNSVKEKDKYLIALNNEIKHYYKNERLKKCLTLEELSNLDIYHEIIEDKKALESLVGYPVRGLSYPFGTYDDRVLSIIESCGIEYSRTVIPKDKFRIPTNYLVWDPTIHIKGNIDNLFDSFMNNRFKELRILYVWGHSYEFNDNNTWDMIEHFCEYAGNKEEVWYATNIEIKDYLDALKQLKISADESIILNPTIYDLWISIDEKKVCIPANTTWKKS